MGFDLRSVFKTKDLKKYSPGSPNLMKLDYTINAKTGGRLARAVLDNGITLIKTLSATGVETQEMYHIPAYSSKAERNDIIKDLSKNRGLTQEMIAAMMSISQSTVSNVLRKKK